MMQGMDASSDDKHAPQEIEEIVDEAIAKLLPDVFSVTEVPNSASETKTRSGKGGQQSSSKLSSIDCKEIVSLLLKQLIPV